MFIVFINDQSVIIDYFILFLKHILRRSLIFAQSAQSAQFYFLIADLN